MLRIIFTKGSRVCAELPLVLNSDNVTVSNDQSFHLSLCFAVPGCANCKGSEDPLSLVVWLTYQVPVHAAQPVSTVPGQEL